MGNYLSGLNKDVCGFCSLKRTPEGHDGCIGTLDNVMNACCGHGEIEMAYVQFNHDDYKNNPNKIRLEGADALIYIRKNEKTPNFYNRKNATN